MSGEHSQSSGFPRRHLALIGYRGSGKSTIGPRVAALAHVPAIDADSEIEVAAGKSIRGIFADQGEAQFRELETQTLRKLLSSRTVAVLSLGGGVILREENRHLLKTCFTVWLTAPVETLLRRLELDAEKREQRPSLTALPPLAEAQRLLADRTPFYAMCADFTVSTDQGSVEQAAQSIFQVWRMQDGSQAKR